MNRFRASVLDRDVVWYLAVAMAAATVVGLFAFSRVHGRPKEFRAVDNPPTALQVLWPLLILVPQAYPFFVVLAPAIAYGWPVPVSFPLDAVVQLAGLAMWAAGGLLVMWAGRALGRFMTVEIVVAKDHELVTAGPYARIRHPTYTGAMLLAAGVALVFLNVLLMATALMAVVVANYRARKEERLLASEAGFAGAYRQYMARTGRFLPALRRA